MSINYPPAITSFAYRQFLRRKRGFNYYEITGAIFRLSSNRVTDRMPDWGHYSEKA